MKLQTLGIVWQLGTDSLRQLQTISLNALFICNPNELQPSQLAIFELQGKREIVCNFLRLSAPYCKQLQSVCNFIKMLFQLLIISVIDLYLIFDDLFQLATYWQAFARICDSMQLFTMDCKK